MLKFALLFLAMALIAGVAAWYADHPGLMTIEWQGWLIEASLGMTLVAILLAIFLLLALYRLLHWLLRGPASYRQAALERRRQRGYSALSDGLVAVAAGDVPLALKQAQRADHMLEDNPLSLLLSAQAAQLDGDDKKAKTHFQAMRERPDTEFLGLRGLLAYARREGDDVEALVLARRAYQLKPKAPWVGRELILLEADQGEWDNAIRHLKQAEKRHTIDGDELRRQRVALFLAQAREAEANHALPLALSLTQKAAAISPLPAAVEAVRLLYQQTSYRKADRVLLAAWSQCPHPDLAALAMVLQPGETPETRLRRLRTLTAKNAEHRESIMLLAEAAKAAGNFAQARDLVAPLLGARANKTVCAFMAELSEAQGRDMEAAREWLRRANDAPGADTWTCDSCQAQSAKWSPECPECGDFASISWPQGTETVVPERPAVDQAPMTAQAESATSLEGPPALSEQSTTETSTVGTKTN